MSAVDALAEDYSVVPVAEACSEACHLSEQCVCTLCKCCTNCSNKCSCNFANTGADESLARHLLPRISPEYMSVKAASEACIALEEKSEEEDIDGEEEEKEEETDVETDGEAVEEVFELF